MEYFVLNAPSGSIIACFSFIYLKCTAYRAWNSSLIARTQ
jgi:hypothetical protein